MKYVIDSSVALKWVLAEQDSDKAIAILTDFRAGNVELLAPDFFPVECGHAMFRAARRRLLSHQDARDQFDALLADLPLLHESTALLSRACAITMQWQTGFYDAVYNALADREQSQFITADSKLARKVMQDLPFVVDLATMP